MELDLEEEEEEEEEEMSELEMMEGIESPHEG
jgi:hypothetical protein